MPKLPDDFFIQKVILMGTGAPGTVALRAELIQLYEQSDDLTQFEARVDDFMNQLVAEKGSISGAIQALFQQGFDIDLALQKIEQLVVDALRQGINSKHEYFTYLINELDSSVDKILDNRADAANAFTNLLDELNIEVNVNDPRVQEWIDKVDEKDESLAIAKGNLRNLIDQLTIPVLIGSDPVDNAVGVPIGANIVLTFSEAVKAGVGEIVIVGDDGHRIPLNVTDPAQVIFNGGSTVTLNPSEDLHLNVNYNVQTISGVITDLAGNPFAGTTDPTALNFSTNDIILPTLVSSDPADNAVGVLVDANIVLTFSEAVKAGVGEIIIVGDDGHRISLNVTDTAQVLFNGGSIVILNPKEDLHLNVNYNVQTASGVIIDLVGNPFAGTTDPTALNFNTNDIIPPTLVSSDPVDNAVGVPINANIVLTFSEAIKAGIGEVVIVGDDGHRISLNVTDTAQVIFNGGSTVTLNPNEDLHLNVNYNVQTASGVITDLAGNPFAGTTDPTALNFNTNEIIPPTLASSAPADNATEVVVGSNIVFTFSEPVRAGSGNIVISDGSRDIRTIPVKDTSQITFNGNAVTINPAADLNPSTTYQVVIDNGAIEDLVGNPYGGSSNLNFDTTITSGLSFNLKFGADALTGTLGNDTFTGDVAIDIGRLVDSLENIDVLNGGRGTDTLNATLEGDITTITTPSLTDIEIINIRNLDKNATISFAKTSGAEQIWNNASAAGRILTYDKAPIAAIFGIRNTQSTTNIKLSDDVTGTNDNLSIATEGAGTKVVESITRAVVQSTTDAANIETMNIEARGSNFVDISAFTAITKLTVTGPGSLNVGVSMAALETVDASANIGGVTLDLASSTANLTVTGGSGNDIITGGKGADVIDGGDGNDTYNVDYSNVRDASVSTVKTTTAPAAGFDKVTVNTGDMFDFKARSDRPFVARSSEVISNIDITGFSGNDLISALDTEYQANHDGYLNREAMLIQFAGGEQFLIVDGGSENIPNSQTDIVIQVIGNVSTLALNGTDGVTIG